MDNDLFLGEVYFSNSSLHDTALFSTNCETGQNTTLNWCKVVSNVVFLKILNMWFDLSEIKFYLNQKKYETSTHFFSTNVIDW
jgi:hypothetical protein